MKKRKNLAHLEVRMRLTSFSSTGTLKCYRSRGKRWTQARNHQISQIKQQIHWFGQWTYPWPKKLIWCQKFRLLQLSHFQALPHQSIPLPNLDTPIESKVNASDVISWVLSKKVWLSVEELLALAPEIRRHFKEATTMKRLLAFPAEPHSKVAHHVTTFSMDTHHKYYLPELALPLQMSRLLWMTRLWLQASLTAAAKSSSSAKIYGKDWEYQ